MKKKKITKVLPIQKICREIGAQYPPDIYFD